MKTPRFVRLTLGLGLLAGGVALAEPENPAISVRLPTASYNVQLTGKDIVSQFLQLSHSPREIRGRAHDATTVITFKEGEAHGNIGGLAVNLKVKTEGDTVKAQGGFAGRPVEVSYSPSELTVYINDCTYRLKNNSEGTYIGRRSCDRAYQRETEVYLPEVFQQLSPQEQVTLLLLSLG
ncbi:hypothetical protein [Hyalangium versicolor]|uniref:hypothetical protein n=1 Tax=Hyalangium versicolor TaxID=2861190 RepID=UPI001CCEAE76|nr:hypothetical protein [Hyalangium versicolor]